MCYHFQTPDMITWLKSQIRVLEAWREDVAMHPELDFDMITRLEQHYQWLTSEVSHLEARQNRQTRVAIQPVLKAI